MRIETHPFPPFIPDNLRLLIIGSFPGREQSQLDDFTGQWYYGSSRNQFWKILSQVYETPLNTNEERRALFETQGIGITDILYQVHRKDNNNLDQNLHIVAYNDAAIRDILQQHPEVPVFFTSRYVEKHFRKHFPQVDNTFNLPSPSPRYAQMRLEEKVAKWRELLPDKL